MSTAQFKILLAVFGCSMCIPLAPAATISQTLKSPGSRTEAPRFSLADASGKTESLADYRGKVVVLNFWATDCGGCRLEIPWLVDIAQTFKSTRAAVIGVSMDISYENLKNAAEAWAKVRPFAAAHRITYPVLMGDGEVTRRYDIQALPVTYLIDGRGRVAAIYVGLVDTQNVKANVSSLIAEHR